jgi:hypothetical protein
MDPAGTRAPPFPRDRRRPEISTGQEIGLAVIPIEDHDSQESGDLQRQRLLRSRGAAAGS